MRIAGLAIPRRDLTGAVREVSPQQAYAAAEIFRPLPVVVPTGKFGIVPAKNFRKRITTRRAPGTDYPRMMGRLSEGSFACKEFGLEEPLDDRTRNIYAVIYDAEAVAADAVRDAMLIDYEFEAKTALENTTTWPLSGNTGYDISSTPWSDHANAKPIDDIAYSQIKARNGGLMLRVLRINWVQWWDLSLNAQILDRLKYTSAPMGLLNLNVLAAALNVDRIIVCTAQYNSANEAQTEAFADIWSNLYVSLLQVAASDNVEEPCIGRTFYYTGDGGGRPDDPMMEEYYEAKNRSTVVRGRTDRDTVVIEERAHFLIKVRTS